MLFFSEVSDPDMHVKLDLFETSYLGSSTLALAELMDQQRREHSFLVKDKNGKRVAEIKAEVRFVHSNLKLYKEINKEVEEEQSMFKQRVAQKYEILKDLCKPFPELKKIIKEEAQSRESIQSPLIQNDVILHKFNSKKF